MHRNIAPNLIFSGEIDDHTDLATMVSPALNVAQRLRDEGLELEVVNASTVKPLDGFCLSRLAEQGRPVFTIEEHVLDGGFGSSVLEYDAAHEINEACTGCGQCVPKCPKKAITLPVRLHVRDANAKVGTNEGVAAIPEADTETRK